jgi:hypothetical protein
VQWDRPGSIYHGQVHQVSAIFLGAEKSPYGGLPGPKESDRTANSSIRTISDTYRLRI